MKKLMAMLFLATFLFSAAACSGENAETTAPSTSETTSSAATSTSTPNTTPEPTEFSLDSSFVIVYPAAAGDSEKAAADSVAAAMEKLGLTVSLQDDNAPAKANEILIGRTAREASQTALNGLTQGGFTLAVNPNEANGYTIALAANSDVGIELAANYFVNTYLTAKSQGTLPVSLTFTHKQRDVKIGGTPLSAFTVVCAKEGAGGDKDVQAAKYADTVIEFVDLLEKATGVRPNILSDTASLPEGGYAILFGNTSYSDDNGLYSSQFKSSGIGVYAARLLPKGHIALAGNNACSALAAGEAMVNALLGESEELPTLNLRGEKDIIHVACVGDSITYGTNSTDSSMQNYPVYLQRMLGYNYYVEKYGAPSHSLIETDTQSFLKHNYFRQSTAAAPDVVIIMLGTNDCRTQRWEDSAYKNWNDPARKEAFLTSGQKLIDGYRNKNADVQIIFSTCPTVPQDEWLGTDWTLRIVRYGNPTIKELAQRNNCPVIDIYTYSRSHPEMFEGGDGLHPQNEQYEILAQGVYDMVKDIIKK